MFPEIQPIRRSSRGRFAGSEAIGLLPFPSESRARWSFERDSLGRFSQLRQQLQPHVRNDRSHYRHLRDDHLHWLRPQPARLETQHLRLNRASSPDQVFRGIYSLHKPVRAVVRLESFRRWIRLNQW